MQALILPIADCQLPIGFFAKRNSTRSGNRQSDNHQYGTVPLSMKTLLRSLSIHFYLTVCLLAGFTVVAGQERSLGSITYRLSMSRPQSHLFEVAIEVEMPESLPDSLDFQMAKWSPGRYAVFDFAKNVQEVRADR